MWKTMENLRLSWKAYNSDFWSQAIGCFYVQLWLTVTREPLPQVLVHERTSCNWVQLKSTLNPPSVTICVSTQFQDVGKEPWGRDSRFFTDKSTWHTKWCITRRINWVVFSGNQTWQWNAMDHPRFLQMIFPLRPSLKKRILNCYVWLPEGTQFWASILGSESSTGMTGMMPAGRTGCKEM